MGFLGGDDPPAPPNLGPITRAYQAAATHWMNMSEQQFNWGQQAYLQNKAVNDLVVGAGLKRQEMLDSWAAEDRQRYQDVYQPLEDQQAYDAMYWASPEKKEAAAGRAEADVAMQFQQARNTAQQRLEQFGVDPSQTRQGALDLQSRVAEAAAQAGAGNTARTNLDLQQLAIREAAINTGKGYPSQALAATGQAGQQGAMAANTGMAGTATGVNAMGSPTDYGQMGTSALGGWGNMLNQNYQNQMAQYNAQQQASSGFGELLGMGLGLGAKFAAGSMGMPVMFAGGGEVPPAGTPLPPTALPTGPNHSGVPVPPGVSPSGGAAPDDVPANLSAGEFVVPEDVVRWRGEQWFQKEIMKARQERENPQKAPAQPQAGPPGPPQPPQIQTALPTG